MKWEDEPEFNNTASSSFNGENTSKFKDNI